LRQEDHPGVAIVMDGQQVTLAALKAGPGKDIWLFGGGSHFRSLAKDELVDTVEVRIVATLLGAGVPLLPSLENRIKLSLTSHKVYRTAIVSLEYAIT
jgi:dihydrofolate reductase